MGPVRSSLGAVTRVCKTSVLDQATCEALFELQSKHIVPWTPMVVDSQHPCIAKPLVCNKGSKIAAQPGHSLGSKLC